LVLGKRNFQQKNKHFGKTEKFAVQAANFLVLAKSIFQQRISTW